MTLRTPLITVSELKQLISTGADDLVILDCSFELQDPDLGRRTYLSGHVPGAIYVNLDTDLSATKTGTNGRHPLPTREDFAARLRILGVNSETLVVVYDQGSSMTAARAWWMLLWLGHERIRVLDGGFTAWKAEGGDVQATLPPPRPAGDIMPGPALVKVLDAATVRQRLGAPDQLIVDARAPARYRGETEPLDRTPGHIPGAINRFFGENTDPATGRFKSAPELAREWSALLAGHPTADVVQQCGSGVSACHNLLAMEVAGLGLTRLYAGSWSEWSANPDNPVAQG